MKTSILKILFALVIFTSISIAQENNENLILIKSFSEKPDCELLLLQLDTLMVEVTNKPQSRGYVVIYGGENPIDNFLWERTVKNYIIVRQFEENRISVLTAKSNQPLKIEAFVATDGSKPDVRERDFNFIISSEKPILFADDAVMMETIDKKDTYLTFGCADCCLNPLDFNILAKFLEANPQLKAEIKIYNRSKKKADKLTKIIMDKIKSENKPSLARLEIKYGGKGNRDKSDSAEISDVKTWLIPRKNTQRPREK